MRQYPEDNIIPTELERALTGLASDASNEPATIGLERIARLAEAHGRSRLDVERAAIAAHLLPKRYLRNWGTVGWQGQARLLDATVAVVGAGGLGGWIIEGLARMGVGHLILVDGDTYQENNLNRQIGCSERSLGRSKVDVMRERVVEVNGAVCVIAHNTWLTAENATTLLDRADVVVDALDTLPARFVLSGAARQLGVPLVHGAIAGYTGQVSTLMPEGPGLAAIYGQGPVPERGVETITGNPSATPMMIAAWQVHEVVKLITGQGEPLVGRMLLLEAEYGQFVEVQLQT